MKNNIRILIVDDEALTARAIKSELKKMGYPAVDIAITYEKAMNYVKTETPDLILLDINLKSEYTGIDLANERRILNKIPIIYITGYNDTQMIDDLLATSPKCHLSKPLRYHELEIAIALALNHKKRVAYIGYDFTYDLENKNLFMRNIPIKLSQNEKRLLEKLIEAQGDFVPFKILEFEIWGNESISNSSLRTLVSNLRKKLNPDMIVNVLAFGYKLKPIKENK